MSWPPPEIPGLVWLQPSAERGFRDGAFAPDASLATARAVVDAIPSRGSLQFLDTDYHGKPPADEVDDYGAIFCVHRDDSQRLFVTCGNHGWSRPWHAVESEPLARFLFECRGSNVGNGPGTDHLRIYRHSHHGPRGGGIDPTLNLLVRKDLHRNQL